MTSETDLFRATSRGWLATARHEIACGYRWMAGQAGLRAWLILIVAGATGIGLCRAAGMPWFVAILATVAAALAIGGVSLGAWLQPDRFTPLFVLKYALPGIVVGGVLSVFPGGFGALSLDAFLAVRLQRLLPALIGVLALLTALSWAVASVSRIRMQRDVLALRAAQEREAVARQLAEARLKLLQGQIQPHFIFNTLAAVQHWVDVGDPRAGPLLRSVTSFLRGSTALLSLDETPLAVELDTVRDYLAIMEARLGRRVRHVVDVDAQAGRRRVPPGVLLTLVENAIEHGLAPAIDGGTLRVRASEDTGAWTLVVCDDGAGLAPDWQEGIGLRNCRERLVQRFGAGATLSLRSGGEGTIATVRIAADAVAG